MDVASNTSSPCGACKFLRRKCVTNCVFAPYFCTEQGPAKFAAIHKVFGASNVSKLLLNLPVHSRYEAATTIAYEAQARVHDPVYGCVAHIFTLQQQVAYLQAQVMQVKEQLASNHINNRSMRTNNLDTYDHHQNNLLGNSDSSMSTNDNWYQPNSSNPISPQSSFESIDQMSDFNLAIEFENNMGELQELAFQMMRN